MSGIVEIPVWDRVVRGFHWSLVACVTTAGVTGQLLRPTWIDVHVWAGSIAAALVVVRIVWGFLGSGPARFVRFVRGPRQVAAHLRDIFSGVRHHHLTHNPLGALMVLATLAAVLALAATGAAVLGGVFRHGPAAGLAGYETGNRILVVHRILAWGLFAMVVVHVGAVFGESRRLGENLVAAMLTGRKRLRADLVRTPADKTPAHHVAAAVISTALVGSGLAIVAGGPMGPVPRPAPADGHPAYAEECSACHDAYAPSLLPSASWRALMAGLEDHFGEDATLDEDTARAITDWLVANAAETADTKPAHLFRNAGLRMTDTPQWKAIHSRLDPALFDSPPIYGRVNCSACHRDAAAGGFYPGNIRIPAPQNPPQPSTAENTT